MSPPLQIDDDLSISMLNTSTAKPPPRNDAPRASEDVEPRPYNCTRHPPQHFYLKLAKYLTV